ncbi:hypothetical protein AB1Y20_019086 [Prymnesium parvum]|uniref:DNA helicase n=1 Tax=Prymnesium parvum TaxID=97485 RepID=A0AB34JTM4_PRYPA
MLSHTDGLACLALEREAERLESLALHESMGPLALQRSGLALHRLHLASIESALYGRTLLTLRLSSSRPLPPSKLTPGAMVSLRAAGAPAASGLTGTVATLRESEIRVAFDELPDDENLVEPLSLALMYNDVTYRRIEKALSLLRDEKQPRAAASLCRALRGDGPPPPPQEATPLPPQQLFNAALNEGQREAVGFALRADPVALIHGPPGTGKTTAVVELIRQAVARGERVLACAASNVAVDNMAERLLGGSGRRLRLVRVGHPARLLPSVVEASLDARIHHSDGGAIVRDVKKDLESAVVKMRGERSKGPRAKLRAEVATLRKELTQRQKKSVRDLLLDAQVVLCTNTGAQDRAFFELPADHAFDLVVIDEAAQALEASCWVALLRGRRAVLAGDHQQLPPVVKSEEAAARGFGVTLFERLLRSHGEAIGYMLTTQYRMHAAICAWASNELYQGRLVADSSVAAHTLSDLPHVKPTEDTEPTLLFVDTAGCDCAEDAPPESEGSTPNDPKFVEAVSKSNKAEAELVVEHVRKLLSAGVRHHEIGVITPYNAQVDLLRTLLEEERQVLSEFGEGAALEVGTVDGFQGREKEAIVISLVRSNQAREVGFLREDRRMNVAITRARRHVAIFGDSDTCSAHPFLKRMVDYFDEHGEVRSAAMFGAAPGACRQQSYAPPPSRPRKDEASEELKLRAQVEAFVADSRSKEMKFGRELTSFERMIIHRIAEDLALQHSSSGEGKLRQIILRKCEAPEMGASSSKMPQVTDVPSQLPPSAVDANVTSVGDGSDSSLSVAELEEPATLMLGAHSEQPPADTSATDAPSAEACHSEPDASSLAGAATADAPAAAEMRARIQQRFSELVRQGTPPNEAAALALEHAQQDERPAGPVASARALPQATSSRVEGTASSDGAAPPSPLLAAARRIVTSNPQATASECLRILNALLQNLARENTAKYRRIHLSNARVQAAVVSTVGAVDFLRKCGFEDSAEGYLEISPPDASSRAAAGQAALARAWLSGSSLKEANPDVLKSAATQPVLQAEEEAEASRKAAELRALHAERQARQQANAASAAAAEKAAADELRAQEFERRAALARQKKERRKAAKEGRTNEAATQEEDIDAILAQLGDIDKHHAQGTGHSVIGDALPWSRDRVQERERQRLKEQLRSKINSGESHKKPARKKQDEKK